MIGWVKEWLEEQRKNGERGLEVKKVGNNFYVYRSTTYWDKALKKIRKHSTYLGKLDKDEGFKKSQRTDCIPQVNTIWQYGNAQLLTQVLDPLIPSLKEGFRGCWEDVFALALVRTMGYVPLKRVQTVWEKLFNVHDLNPDLSPKMLSRVLKSVGLNRKGQNRVFNYLSVKGDEFVYDLSCFFTQSEGIHFAEQGYNTDHVQLKQVNLALLCSVDSGLPTMIRLIPGSVRDITSLYGSLEEIGLQGKILILDRGFYSLYVIDFLREKQVFFVLPTRRNNSLYTVRIHVNQHLFYHERLIKYGKRRHDGFFLYLFEDVQLRLEEEKHLYSMLDEQRVDKDKLKVKMKRAGRILIVSNLDVSPEEIFLLYKKRDGVENLFDVYKTMLQADRTYLRDNESIFGHAFISFLSLYAYSSIHQLIKKAGLESKLSPLDVLEQYSKVYQVDCGDTVRLSEVPKKVRLLDEKLGTNIFPN